MASSGEPRVERKLHGLRIPLRHVSRVLQAASECPYFNLPKTCTTTNAPCRYAGHMLIRHFRDYVWSFYWSQGRPRRSLQRVYVYCVNTLFRQVARECGKGVEVFARPIRSGTLQAMARRREDAYDGKPMDL